MLPNTNAKKHCHKELLQKHLCLRDLQLRQCYNGLEAIRMWRFISIEQHSLGNMSKQSQIVWY